MLSFKSDPIDTESLLLWSIKNGSPYLAQKLIYEAQVEITSAIWTEACKYKRLDIFKMLVSKTYVYNSNSGPFETERAFSRLFDDGNILIRKTMTEKSDLAYHLQDLHEKVKGVKAEAFNFSSAITNSELESEMVFNLMKEANLTPEEGIWTFYHLDLLDGCQFWAPELKLPIEHESFSKLNFEIYFPECSKAVPVFCAVLDGNLSKLEQCSNTMTIDELGLAADRNGFTTLHLASILGHEDIVNHLLR